MRKYKWNTHLESKVNKKNKNTANIYQACLPTKSTKMKHFPSKQWTTYNWKQNQNSPPTQGGIPREKKKFHTKKKTNDRRKKNERKNKENFTFQKQRARKR